MTNNIGIKMGDISVEIDDDSNIIFEIDGVRFDIENGINTELSQKYNIDVLKELSNVVKDLKKSFDNGPLENENGY